MNEADLIFRQECVFVAGADTPDRIPEPTVGELAFAGRSNVGKSSLINALTDRKGLARASNTPGRTQQINFFDLGGKFFLVDLPGYGYARASKEKVHAWNEMIRDYLRLRQTLKKVCVLIDSRHGIKAVDQDTMEMLNDANVPFAIVLTKADKIKTQELEALISKIEDELKSYRSAHPKVFPTSSEKKTGLSELRAFLVVR